MMIPLAKQLNHSLSKLGSDTIKFEVITYKNPKDFKFASWQYEHQTDGGTVIFGILKKTNCRAKYQKIFRSN